MSIAYAAENVSLASSRQVTVSAMLLVAILLLLTLALATWSWHRRKGMAERRRLAEAALRATEDRLRQATGQLPLAVFEFIPGPPARFSSISEGVARLLPARSEDILANPDAFFAGLNPEDRAGLAWNTAAAGGAVDFEWIGRSLKDVEQPLWLQICATTAISTTGERAIHGAMLDVSALKRSQQDLERSREELRRLASHREQRVEQERARLAREFHDELGQVLTTARMKLQLLERGLDADASETRQALQTVEAMIGEAGRSVKAIASDLRPAALNLGLAAALEWVAERVLTPAGIAYSVSVTPLADTLNDNAAIALFRIVQESLNNIVRHAAAGNVHISLARLGADLLLMVEDDGKGFDASGVDHRGHFGLLGIGERVTALGGTLEIDSAPGSGTRVNVSIPATATIQGEAT